jgi:hypothetical protein
MNLNSYETHGNFVNHFLNQTNRQIENQFEFYN